MPGMYIKCYYDLCLRGGQYCGDEGEKCYPCTDVAHLCGTPDLPWQCDSFCIEQKVRVLDASLSKWRSGGTMQEDYKKGVLVLGAASSALFILFVVFAIWVYRLKQKKRQTYLVSKESKLKHLEICKDIPLKVYDDPAYKDENAATINEGRELNVDKETSMASLLESVEGQGCEGRETSPTVISSVDCSSCSGPIHIRIYPRSAECYEDSVTKRP